MDLTKVNECVKRERHPQPSVDHVLGQIELAKVFTELLALPLSEESAKLTTFIEPNGIYFLIAFPLVSVMLQKSSRDEYLRYTRSILLAWCCLHDGRHFGTWQHPGRAR